MPNNNLLAFVTGLGTGYIGSKDKEAKQAREDEDRAMRKELHTANMDSLNQKKADMQALRNAGAERTATPGTAVETGAGKNLYFSAAQAGVAADDARIEAEMRGTPAGSSRLAQILKLPFPFGKVCSPRSRADANSKRCAQRRRSQKLTARCPNLSAKCARLDGLTPIFWLLAA